MLIVKEFCPACRSPFIFNGNFKVDLSMVAGTLTRLDQLSYVAALLLKKKRSKLVKFSRLIENGIIMESFQLPVELDLSLLKLRLGLLSPRLSGWTG